uniref:Dual specificity phosphatase 15 n=1 Tax=Ovis aries TaxID=9940 RepID=A0AC11CZX8_SHEEP
PWPGGAAGGGGGGGWAELGRAADAGPPDPRQAAGAGPGPSGQLLPLPSAGGELGVLPEPRAQDHGEWYDQGTSWTLPRKLHWFWAEVCLEVLLLAGKLGTLPCTTSSSEERSLKAGLYLRNFTDAKDTDQLGRNKITHIISIHESPQPLLQDITYLRISVADAPEVPIKKHFKECINFIHCCRLNGGNCLVHCFAGISRSTTIVTAYVMTVTGLSWRDVLEAIKATRPIANPNPGFRQQLEEFGWGSSRKLRRQLEERFGESPFRDEEEVRALLPLCKRCRQGSASAAASPAPNSTASEGTLQRLVPRSPREAHRPLPLLARVKQTFSCLPRCLSRKGSK